MEDATAPSGQRAELMRARLTEAFAPSFCEVVNESHLHGFSKGRDSHFNVRVVSSVFAGQSLLKRHRAVSAALGGELTGAIHAMSVHAHTPEEWELLRADDVASPRCAGHRSSV